MPGSRLLLVTQSYPYGQRTDFLEDEIEHLAAQFEAITVAPTAPRGDAQPMPQGADVDLSLSRDLTRGGRLRAVARPAGLRAAAGELRRHPEALRRPRHATAALLGAGARAAAARWRAGLDDVALTYCYWLTPVVAGIGSVGGAPVVSRVHGGDLFLERSGGYLPFQEQAIAGADFVASVSEHGAEYLRRHYPGLAARLVVRRLGVVGFPAAARSTDGVLRIVTCASLTDVKRPLLAAAAIAEVASRRPVRWDHFGDGPLRGELEQHMTSATDCAFRVHGAVPNDRVREHFGTEPVDVFVNTSSSEGVPVSVMEAQSAGVPTVATDVGGTSEVVSPQLDELLAADAEPPVIADAIERAADGDDRAEQRRAHWAERFDAHSNYAQFASWLRDLADGGIR